MSDHEKPKKDKEAPKASEPAAQAKQKEGFLKGLLKIFGVSEDSPKGLIFRNVVEIATELGALVVLRKAVDAIFHRTKPAAISTDPDEGEPQARSLYEGKDRWARIMMKAAPPTQVVLGEWFDYMGGFKSYRAVDFKTTLIVMHTRPRKAEDEKATLTEIVGWLNGFAGYFAKKYPQDRYPKPERFEAMIKRAVDLELIRPKEEDYAGFRVRVRINELLSDKERLERMRQRVKDFGRMAKSYVAAAGGFILENAAEGLSTVVDCINALDARAAKGLPREYLPKEYLEDESEADADVRPSLFARLVARSH